jgi:hypothetical protein
MWTVFEPGHLNFSTSNSHLIRPKIEGDTLDWIDDLGHRRWLDSPD